MAQRNVLKRGQRSNMAKKRSKKKVKRRRTQGTSFQTSRDKLTKARPKLRLT